LMNEETFAIGSTGAPMPCVEVKLVSVPEAGYFIHNSNPQGEVWIRGSAVSKSYFKMPQLTQETHTADGWFKTGDIGEWLPVGTLKIIDRIKNLVKLSQGEYIALERLESHYKTCEYVLNVCVYADSFKSAPVALLVAKEDRLRALATRLGVIPAEEHVELSEYANHPLVVKELGASLNAIGKRSSFKSFELLANVYVVDEEWTPQNGLLTAAMKLKRGDIVKKYKSHLDAISSD